MRGRLANPPGMSLFLATMLPGLLLLAVGGALVWNGPPVQAGAMRFLRSQVAAYVTMGLGSAWFLYYIANLGKADFGDYKVPLFILFAGLAVLSFRYVNEFLSVRGLAVLTLLVGGVLLRAAYMRYDDPQRLFLVVAVYAAIVAALYLGAVPYRLRDFFEWLWQKQPRPRILGGLLAGYGLLLAIVSFTY